MQIDVLRIDLEELRTDCESWEIERMAEGLWMATNEGRGEVLRGATKAEVLRKVMGVEEREVVN